MVFVCLFVLLSDLRIPESRGVVRRRGEEREEQRKKKEEEGEEEEGGERERRTEEEVKRRGRISSSGNQGHTHSDLLPLICHGLPQSPQSLVMVHARWI